MTSILAMEKCSNLLRVMLFVTQPRSAQETQSHSPVVQMFPGRPNIETLLDLEIESQIGALGVSVCGVGGLSDDVRRAARTRQHADFVEEASTW